jgi:signal transduction histidine kinase
MVGKRFLDWAFGPLRAKTTAVAVFVVAFSLSLSAAVLISIVRRNLDSSVINSVSSRGDDVATLVQEDRLPVRLAFRGEDAAMVQVVNSSGSVIASTPNILGEPRITSFEPRGANPQRITLKSLPVDRGQRFVVVAQRAAGSNGPVIIYTAASLDAADSAVRTLSTALLMGVPFLTVLVGATTWKLTGTTLRPVEQMRLKAREISALDLHRRLPVPSNSDEVSRLATTMNDMLDGLERSANRQKQFVADASHELRSPLTVMRTIVEVNLAHPERADWIATSEELLTLQARVERLVTDMLTLARIDAVRQSRPPRPVNLSDLVRKEVTRRPPTPITLVTNTANDVTVVGDADQLVQILTNLLDNAERYARTRVEVSAQTEGSTAVLRVADDGPGIAPADRQRVFERFTRLDGARSREEGGSGLGLAIVSDLVRAHGGSVGIRDYEGRIAFEVRIPLAGRFQGPRPSAQANND